MQIYMTGPENTAPGDHFSYSRTSKYNILETLESVRYDVLVYG